eukprot:g8842.t1 g8842   contig34:247820-248422(-)
MDTSFNDVIDTIGIEIYCFLHPKDLFSFSLCSHNRHNRVSASIVKICTRHLPIRLGIDTNYPVVLAEGHSFSSKKQVKELMLEKIHLAKLQVPHDTNSSFDLETSVEYHHHDEIDNESALHWVNYILDRDACRNGKGKGSFNFVREWLRYVISQRDVYIGLWRWNLNNRNLHAQGMFGVGVKISTLEPRAEMELRLTRLY